MRRFALIFLAFSVYFRQELLGEKFSDAEILRHRQLKPCRTDFQETRTLQPIRSEIQRFKFKEYRGHVITSEQILNWQNVSEKKGNDTSHQKSFLSINKISRWKIEK